MLIIFTLQYGFHKQLLSILRIKEMEGITKIVVTTKLDFHNFGYCYEDQGSDSLFFNHRWLSLGQSGCLSQVLHDECL